MNMKRRTMLKTGVLAALFGPRVAGAAVSEAAVELPTGCATLPAAMYEYSTSFKTGSNVDVALASQYKDIIRELSQQRESKFRGARA